MLLICTRRHIVLPYRKRYEKAEKEFVEAKMLLFNKMERKEQLTEHLCHIIEANECRKANKLSELMQKLELHDGAIVADDIGQVSCVLKCCFGISFLRGVDCFFASFL